MTDNHTVIGWSKATKACLDFLEAAREDRARTVEFSWGRGEDRLGSSIVRIVQYEAKKCERV